MVLTSVVIDFRDNLLGNPLTVCFLRSKVKCVLYAISSCVLLGSTCCFSCLYWHDAYIRSVQHTIIKHATQSVPGHLTTGYLKIVPLRINLISPIWAIYAFFYMPEKVWADVFPFGLKRLGLVKHLTRPHSTCHYYYNTPHSIATYDRHGGA